MSYDIANFWVPRLAGIDRSTSSLLLDGWSVQATPWPAFIEAELRLRKEHNNLDMPIWFIAAPGAVGKSTLAKEISARTGAVYVDLAVADTVAGNYATGGLVKTNLLERWKSERTTLLIDALDEARLRVTQKSFDDFLDDVVSLVSRRNLPIVLFGRAGIVDEAWLILDEKGLRCPIFDIDFFDDSRAQRFVMSALERLSREKGWEALGRSLAAHWQVYEQAVHRFLDGLRTTAADDGDRFAGYAPVLDAVARVLGEEVNPSKLDEATQLSAQRLVLQQLTERILHREALKLRNQLPASIPENVKGRLYVPEEQLDRLAATILGLPAPPAPAALHPDHAAAYDMAVQGLMPQHPFLDGSSRRPSGAVFAGAILAHSLLSPRTEAVVSAARYATSSRHAPNPFLVDFYLDRAAHEQGPNPLISPEHIGLLYDSFRAGAAIGESTRLSIDGDDLDEEVDVEMQIGGDVVRRSTRRVLYRSSQAGTLRFGHQVSGVFVNAPLLDAEIGSGEPVELIAPFYMNVDRLAVACSELVVTPGEMSVLIDDTSAIIEARELISSTLAKAPIVRKGAELRVSWPNALSYPWSSFASINEEGNQTETSEALRAFRRLVLAFRSHSKGRLARFQDKIEHGRMTKGAIGVAIRKRMLTDGIISLEGNMYFLDPDALGKVTGANYLDLKMTRFNAQTRQYVSKIAADLQESSITRSL